MADKNEVEANIDAREELERDFITQDEIEKAREKQIHDKESAPEYLEGVVPSEAELRFAQLSPAQQRAGTFVGEVYRGDVGSKGARFKEGMKKGGSTLWKGAKAVAGVTGKILKKGAEVTIPAVAGSYRRVREEQAQRKAKMEAGRAKDSDGSPNRRKSFFEIAQDTQRGRGDNFASPKAGWPSFTEMAEQVRRKNAQAMAGKRAQGAASPHGGGIIVASAGWPSFIEMGRTHQAQTKSGWFNEPVNHGLAAKGIKVRRAGGKRSRR